MGGLVRGGCHSSGSGESHVVQYLYQVKFQHIDEWMNLLAAFAFFFFGFAVLPMGSFPLVVDLVAIGPIGTDGAFLPTFA